MLALASAEELRERGVREIPHMRPAKFYTQLLGGGEAEDTEEAEVPQLGALACPEPGMDDSDGWDPEPEITGAPAAFAEATAAAAAPDAPLAEGTEATAAAAPARTHAPAEAFQFGDFALSRVKGHLPGRYRAWEARCPYHRNPGDHAKTTCRKRLQLPDEERTQLLLRQWCLAGLEISTDEQLAPRTLHGLIDPKTLLAEPLQDLTARLERAQAAEPLPPALCGRRPEVPLATDEGPVPLQAPAAARGRGGRHGRGRGARGGRASPPASAGAPAIGPEATPPCPPGAFRWKCREQ